MRQRLDGVRGFDLAEPSKIDRLFDGTAVLVGLNVGLVDKIGLAVLAAWFAASLYIDPSSSILAAAVAVLWISRMIWRSKSLSRARALADRLPRIEIHRERKTPTTNDAPSRKAEE
jgi:hypothetical protein